MVADLDAAHGLVVAQTPDVAAATAAREATKLEKRLLRQVSQAVSDFGLIEPGDKVMVCVSGGKDSYGMLDMLMRYQRLHWPS